MSAKYFMGDYLFVGYCQLLDLILQLDAYFTVVLNACWLFLG